MRVYLGNAEPVGAPGPAVSYTDIDDAQNEDGSYVCGFVIGTNAAEVKDHLFDNPGLVTHLPGNGAILGIVNTYASHGSRPTWVAVEAQGRNAEEAEDFERFLSEFWKCDRGVPEDIEDTHYTASGPPGTGPA